MVFFVVLFFVIFIGEFVEFCFFDCLYIDGLIEVVQEGDLWQMVWYMLVLIFDGVVVEVDCCILFVDKGEMVLFIVFDVVGCVFGFILYYDFVVDVFWLYIGYMWN